MKKVKQGDTIVLTQNLYYVEQDTPHSGCLIVENQLQEVFFKYASVGETAVITLVDEEGHVIEAAGASGWVTSLEDNWFKVAAR